MRVLVHLQSYTAKKGCLLTFPLLGDSPGASRCAQIFKKLKSVKLKLKSAPKQERKNPILQLVLNCSICSKHQY